MRLQISCIGGGFSEGVQQIEEDTWGTPKGHPWIMPGSGMQVLAILQGGTRTRKANETALVLLTAAAPRHSAGCQDQAKPGKGMHCRKRSWVNAPVKLRTRKLFNVSDLSPKGSHLHEAQQVQSSHERCLLGSCVAAEAVHFKRAVLLPSDTAQTAKRSPQQLIYLLSLDFKKA